MQSDQEIELVKKFSELPANNVVIPEEDPNVDPEGVDQEIELVKKSSELPADNVVIPEEDLNVDPEGVVGNDEEQESLETTETNGPLKEGLFSKIKGWGSKLLGLLKGGADVEEEEEVSEKSDETEAMNAAKRGQAEGSLGFL
jgi:hypothetical protein